MAAEAALAMKPSAEEGAGKRLVLYRMNLLLYEQDALDPSMTLNLRNALLIHNPNAGNGGSGRRRMLDEARRIFASGGIEADLVETIGAGHATEIAPHALHQGRQLFIPCGGDRTLHDTVTAPPAHPK